MASNWLDQSIVAKRGIGWSKKPHLHDLTEALQGKYHYTIGPYSDPVLTVRPGDRIRIETRDAFEGAIRTERDKPTAKLRMPFVNPQNGPIMIDGAEPGDAIAVHIETMLPRGENPCGTCCMIPHFGALTGIGTLNEALPELTRKIHVDEKHVRWSTRVTLPYNPHIGTLSTSPEIDSINSLTPDSHGGNMDLPDVAPGAIIYFPVHTEGGLLYVGDCHATQGDGELSGVALEQRATVTLQIDLIKNWSFAWPRLETRDFIMTIGSARPLEDATRIAYRELVLWMEAEYGFDRWDAYMMLSQCGRVRLGNFVDPKYTVGAGILKSWLAP